MYPKEGMVIVGCSVQDTSLYPHSLIHILSIPMAGSHTFHHVQKLHSPSSVPLSDNYHPLPQRNLRGGGGQDIATHTKVSPSAREKAFRSFLQRVRATPKAVEELEGWGLNLESGLVDLSRDHRRLPVEKVLFKNKTVVTGDDADWGRDAVKEQQIVAVSDYIAPSSVAPLVGSRSTSLLPSSSIPLSLFPPREREG